MSRRVGRLDRLRTHPRIRDLGWSLTAELLKLGSSILLFLLVARTLGVRDYGVFAGCFALVASVGPFANLGAGHVLIRAIAQGAKPDDAFGFGLFRILCGGVAGLIAVWGLQALFLPVLPLVPLLLFGLGELWGTALTDLSAQRSFAEGQARRAAHIRLTVGLLRLAAALSLVGLSARGYLEASVAHWAALYAFAMLGAGVLSISLVSTGLARPSLLRLKGLVTGLPFSLNVSAAYVQDDIDKALILKYSGEATAGFYAAGYRVINFAYVPLQAALNILYPKFFKAAAEGGEAAWSLTRRLWLPALAYGALSAAGLYLFSFLVGPILGEDFAGAGDVLVLLCWLPLVRAFAYDFADFCTAMGGQWLRVACQISGALLNVALNILLIPAVGWRGAVYASLASELITLSLLCCSALIVRRFREGGVVAGM